MLAPLIFLLYINDLHKSDLSFADDAGIIPSNNSLEVLSKRINKDLILTFQLDKDKQIKSKFKEDKISDF